MEDTRYKPLKSGEIKLIHEAALNILYDIGISGVIPVIEDAAGQAGLKVDSDGRLRFPKSFVEDIIEGACHRFVLAALDEKHDIELGGNKVYYGTGGEAISVLDFHTGRYRPSTLLDIYDSARLVDTLEHVDRYTNILIPTEIKDFRKFAINRTYASLAGTSKIFGLTVVKPEFFDDIIALCDMVLGSEGAFLKRPFGLIGACPVVSPLTFGEDSAELICGAALRGIPTMSVIAGQAGTTAPASLAGALAQNTAETLAALIMVNLIRPGHPMLFGNWPFVSDLRTACFSGGGGEQALLAAAAVQMARFYDLPCSIGAGMTDSKVPDAQAGYEKGISVGLAANAGANLVMESCGMTASLLGVSYEALVIDNEMLGNIKRTIRGIEVNSDTLDPDVIKGVIQGSGHYLDAEQTMSLMRSEYHYPDLGDRSSPADWENAGSMDICERARSRVSEILSSYYPEHIPKAVDEKIRQHFPILLDHSEMIESSRWTKTSDKLNR